MFRPSPELVILTFGILSVLAGLENLPEALKKPKLFLFLFVVGLITQATTHVFQYGYAVTNKTETEKRVDAETAIALFAYTENDVGLLRATTADSYLVGYRLFKNGALDQAVPFFRQSITEQRYVASSYFLLAHIATHDDLGRIDPHKDWTPAYHYLERSIKNNPNYTPAYYLLAELYANTNRIDEALALLPKAIMMPRFGLVPCRNMNRPHNLEVEWAPLRDNPQFTQMRRQCLEVHGLSLPNVSPPNSPPSIGTEDVTH